MRFMIIAAVAIIGLLGVAALVYRQGFSETDVSDALEDGSAAMKNVQAAVEDVVAALPTA
jgi:hypothetical protein